MPCARIRDPRTVPRTVYVLVRDDDVFGLRQRLYQTFFSRQICYYYRMLSPPNPARRYRDWGLDYMISANSKHK